MHALTAALPRAMRRIRPLPCGTKLNSRKRHIGFYEVGKRLTTRYRPSLISTLDRSAVDRNEQNAKKKRTEKTEKNTAMMKDEFFHDTNGLLISHARERVCSNFLF